MLLHLAIQNLAVFEEAEISFSRGLHVLSGETGAGKSVVLRALRLALGHRASRACVRTGADAAVVTLRLSHEGREHVIERTLPAQGPARCSLDGRAISVAALRAFGSRVITICGQHDARRLLEPETHRVLLDRFAGIDTGPMAAAYARHQATVERASELDRATDSAPEKAAFLRYQVEELAGHAPVIGEHARLIGERASLHHAVELRQASQAAEQELYGADGAVVDRLARVEQQLSRLSTIAPEHARRAQRAHSLRLEAEALAEELRDVGELEADPGRLDQLEARISEGHRLSRKHRCGPDDLSNTLERLQDELDTLEHLEERREAAHAQVAATRAAALEQGRAISEQRALAAPTLDRAVTDRLLTLAMPHARFTTRIDEGPLALHGIDQVAFLLGANLGEADAPLHKVASGGELSRVLLAIQLALGTEGPHNYVFDEIDSGLGGHAAGAVGARLTELAQHGQVLVISHLPQIARLAGTHHAVTKWVRDGRTHSDVRSLEGPERVAELARMLGGDALGQLSADFAAVWMGEHARVA
jgi:DNA repair protein RecN (Recombination protein N)